MHYQNDFVEFWEPIEITLWMYVAVLPEVTTKMLYAQESQENFLHKKFVERPGIEPITLSINIVALKLTLIWLYLGPFLL